MCGRVDLGGELSIASLMDFFQITATTPQASQIGNTDVRPTQTMPVVLGLPVGGRALQELRWGLPPFEGRHGDLINAKSENLLKWPRYRSALKHRRCIVPVGAFYEWRPEPGRAKKAKYRITLTGEPVMCLAGIWEEGEPGHSDIPTFAIITCAPNELVAQFHDRMPAILNKEAVDLWLDPDFDNTQALHSLLAPYPPAEMKVEEAPPDKKPPRVISAQASDEDGHVASIEQAGIESEDHEDVLRNLNAHARCTFFESRNGAVFYCGVIDPHRPTVRTKDGWRCSKHGGQSEQLSLNDLFDL